MKQFVKVMKALSDPNRVTIVKMLQAKDERCVCELVAALGLAQPTVSKHLKVLEEAGLVSGRRQGSWAYYRLDGSDNAPYAPAMLQLLDGWLNEAPDTATALERIADFREAGPCPPPAS